MNPGLGKGFVKFGSCAHAILLKFHELGDMDQLMLAEELPQFSFDHIGMTIFRLRDNGFIARQDRASKYQTGHSRTMWKYGLGPRPKRYDTLPVSDVEKCARSRAAAKLRTPSVFEFRGQIHV